MSDPMIWHRSVAVSGLKNLDSTVWARGCAYYDLDGGDAPEWLTVPHEWPTLRSSVGLRFCDRR